MAVVVDWFGPYKSLPEAQAVAKAEFESGLYVAIGKLARQRTAKRIQYIGIGELWTRLKVDHHKLSYLKDDLEIWLGTTSSPKPSGPRGKKTDPLLDMVEWAHAYFLKLPLNEKKTVNPPTRGVTVVNSWWRTDLVTPRLRRPHQSWPVLIDYAGEGFPVRVSWGWDRRFERPASL